MRLFRVIRQVTGTEYDDAQAIKYSGRSYPGNVAKLMYWNGFSISHMLY